MRLGKCLVVVHVSDSKLRTNTEAQSVKRHVYVAQEVGRVENGTHPASDARHHSRIRFQIGAKAPAAVESTVSSLLDDSICLLARHAGVHQSQQRTLRIDDPASG